MMKLMNIDKFFLKRNYFSVILLLSTIIVSIYYFTVGIFFETNDDHFIAEILSGSLTGTPDYHTIYTGVFFSVPISLLYRVIPSFSWYGVALIAALVVAYSLASRAFISCVQGVSNQFVFLFGDIAFFASLLYLNTNIQYTSISLICAAFGFVCLLFDEDRNRGLVSWGIIELLAYSIRPESMEIVQPIGFFVYFGVLVSQYKKRKNFKVFLSALLKSLAISVMIILVGVVTYKFCYNTDEWKRALEVNESRTLLMDYYGTYSPDEIVDLLAENDISKEEYDAYFALINYDWDNSSELLGILAQKASLEKAQDVVFVDVAKWTVSGFYSDMIWGYKRTILVCAMVQVLGVLLLKKWSVFLYDFCFFLGKLISLGYIYYKGRMPFRIMYPFWILELVFWILTILYISMGTEYLRQRLYSILFLVVFAWVIYYTLKPQIDRVGALLSQNVTFSVTDDVILDYCNSHPENKYILLNNAFAYWKKTPFEIIKRNDNCIYSGGWFAVSPAFKIKANQYLSDGAIHFIGIEMENEMIPAKAFFEKKYGKIPQLLEQIEVKETGVVYSVYCAR